MDVNTYQPSSETRNMHNIPRFSGRGEFDASNSTYIRGLYLAGMPFVVIAFLFLFIMPLAQVQIHRKVKIAHKATTELLLRILTVGGLCLVIAGTVIAFDGSGKAAAGVHAAVGALEVVGAWIGNIENVIYSVYNPVTKSGFVESATVAANNISQLCPPASSSVSGINAQGDLIKNAVGIFRNGTGGLRADIDFLKTAIDTYDTKRETATLVGLVFTVVLSVINIVSLLQLTFGRHSYLCLRMSTALGWFISPFTIILTVVVWCLLGVAFAFAAAAGDFCYSPGNALAKSVPPNLQDTVTYYTNCGAVRIPRLESPVINQLTQVVTASFAALSDVVKLQAQLNSTCLSAKTASSELMTNVNATYHASVALTEQAQCLTVNPLYMATLQPLCSTMIHGLVLLWVGLFLVSLFLFFSFLFFRCLSKKASYEIEEHKMEMN